MDYTFNNMGRTDNDSTDKTQQNLSNTRYANYTTFSLGGSTDSHMKFAMQQPGFIPNGLTFGSGLNGSVVDAESILKLKTKEERPYDKLQLLQRPYATVPFLGRGFSNPVLESQLQQGEIIRGRPSVSTVTEQSFLNYSMHPTDDLMVQRVKDSSFTIEESANKDWVRGGADTRITTDDLYWKNK
jgi:hypothetical protein